MQQLSGGWIKLYRSLADHGHLQMPDQALKVFIYLLLEVNHTPNAGCAAGEGWITYRRIREACCDPSKPQWSDHTISGALEFLEQGGYIRRIKTKIGAAQRLRILTWHKYQGQSAAVTAEVRTEVSTVVIAEVTAEPSAEKQESQESQEKKEEEEAPAAPASSASGEGLDWETWWLRKSASSPSAIHRQDFTAMKDRGVTDELIIAIGEKCLAPGVLKGQGHPLGYVRSVIAGLVARGVTSLEAWKQDEAAKEEAKAVGPAEGRVTKHEADVPDVDADLVREEFEKLRRGCENKLWEDLGQRGYPDDGRLHLVAKWKREFDGSDEYRQLMTEARAAVTAQMQPSRVKLQDGTAVRRPKSTEEFE